jgi:hypothetical protein
VDHDLVRTVSLAAGGDVRGVLSRALSRDVVADRLIPEFLNLQPGGRRPDLPVIVLLAARGNGKSTLVEEIGRRCSGRRPCSVVDFAEVGAVRPYQLAATLAFGLGERAGQFGRLRFPRLLLGMAVIGSQLHQTERDRARAELDALLADRSRLVNGFMSVLHSLSEGLLNEVAVPAGRPVIEAIEAAARSTLRAVQRQTSPAFLWYRNGLDRTFTDARDALIDLNRRESKPSGRHVVDETLCRALLADLRAGYEALRGRRRTGNVVALLDNADTGSARSFLEILVAARDRHAATAPDDCDPLLVVATTGERPPATLGGEDRDGPRPVRDASRPDWTRTHLKTSKRWVYPVALDDVGPAEVALLARQWPAVESAAPFVARLTGGHLWGAHYLLEVLDSETEANGRPDLRTVLGLPDPTGGERTVAETVIDRLLPRASADLRRDLVTCSAARDLAAGTRQRAFRDGPSAADELDRFCRTDLLAGPWVRQAGGVLRLHPFLRRVLLHQLALRPDDDADNWTSVHARLEKAYADREDRTAARYHGLAGGGVAAAVSCLEPLLAAAGSSRWLAEVDSITAAPRRPGTGDSPREEVQAAVATAATDPALSHLVAALWISADPLGDPEHTLDVPIAADLDHLATRALDDADALRDRAHEYRTRKQDWTGLDA